MAQDEQHSEIGRAPTPGSTSLDVSRVLALIGNKWTILIVDLLRQGSMRFAELRRSIDCISSRMLAITLQRLVAAGLVTRTQHPEIPPRVEYCLTPLGRTLVAPASDMLSWAKAHHAEIRHGLTRSACN